MKRNMLTSPRLQEIKKARKKAFINKIILSIVAVVVVFAAFAYLSRIPSLNIAQVEVSGNKVVDAEMVKAVAGEKIEGKYLWLFPKTNIFLYPKSAVKDSLLADFTRFKDVSVKVEDPSKLRVSIAERVPAYIWCGEELGGFNNTKDEKCYFMDDLGFIFDRAPYFSGDVYFKFYGALDAGRAEPAKAPLGQYYSSDFTKLIAFKEVLKAMGLKPVSININDKKDMEVYLSSPTLSREGPKLILKSNANFEKVAENLQASISTDPLKSDLKNKYSSLLYIDLRYGNKVYFKFQP